MSDAASKPTWRQRLREACRNAFALEDPASALGEEDHALLDRLAEKVVRRELALPAVMLLQSLRPLNSIGSQAMVFLRPFLAPLLNPADYDRVARILERRDGLATFADAIEAAQARTENSPLEP